MALYNLCELEKSALQREKSVEVIELYEWCARARSFVSAKISNMHIEWDARTPNTMAVLVYLPLC